MTTDERDTLRERIGASRRRMSLPELDAAYERATEDPGFLEGVRRIDEAFDATVGDGLNEDVKEE